MRLYPKREGKGRRGILRIVKRGRRLNLINEVYMSEHMFTATVATETEIVQDLILRSVGDRFSIHVECSGRLSATKLLHLGLVEEPFVGEKVAAIHTTNGDNHGA